MTGSTRVRNISTLRILKYVSTPLWILSRLTYNLETASHILKTIVCEMVEITGKLVFGALPKHQVGTKTTKAASQLHDPSALWLKRLRNPLPPWRSIGHSKSFLSERRVWKHYVTGSQSFQLPELSLKTWWCYICCQSLKYCRWQSRIHSQSVWVLFSGWPSFISKVPTINKECVKFCQRTRELPAMWWSTKIGTV